MTGSVTKQVNAFVESSSATQAPSDGFPPLSRAAIAGAILEHYRQRHGGNWVGGTATLTDRSVDFRANAANRQLNPGELDFSIDLGVIQHVDVTKAFATDIIGIHTPQHVARLRCFGAAGFAAAIREAASRAR